jgi:hypothetical protein
MALRPGAFLAWVMKSCIEGGNINTVRCLTDCVALESQPVSQRQVVPTFVILMA